MSWGLRIRNAPRQRYFEQLCLASGGGDAVDAARVVAVVVVCSSHHRLTTAMNDRRRPSGFDLLVGRKEA